MTGTRVLAIIFDSTVLGLVFGVMSNFFGTTSASSGSVSVSVNGIRALASFVIFVLYFTLLAGYLGQTVGKMLLGIEVVREDNGELPGVGSASKDPTMYRGWPFILLVRLRCGIGLGKKATSGRRGSTHSRRT